MKPTERAGIMAILNGFHSNYREACLEAHREGEHEVAERFFNMATLADRIGVEIGRFLDDCKVDEEPEETHNVEGIPAKTYYHTAAGHWIAKAMVGNASVDARGSSRESALEGLRGALRRNPIHAVKTDPSQADPGKRRVR